MANLQQMTTGYRQVQPEAPMRAPLPTDIADNMTINRVQQIERSLVELRDVVENRLSTILVGATPEVQSDSTESMNRTFLERSLTDVELAIGHLQRTVGRITI